MTVSFNRPAIHGISDSPPDVTPHTLRHSFASVAADLNFGDATIGALLGHKGHGITRRYVHSADAVLLAAADAVAQEIATMMGETPVSLSTHPVDPPEPCASAGIGGSERDEYGSRESDFGIVLNKGGS
jgi:hypothetical protein